MIPDLWYQNAIIYNIDLESFYDSNGDGVGDFAGLVERLDYIESLGVDTVTSGSERMAAIFCRSPPLVRNGTIQLSRAGSAVRTE